MLAPPCTEISHTSANLIFIGVRTVYSFQVEYLKGLPVQLFLSEQNLTCAVLMPIVFVNVT